MHKTVSMMMAHLQSAREESNLNADASRAIVLLDFRKAYDTVDRDFMVEALRLFGFDKNFLALMQRLHTNTTAWFSVNGELSSVRPVRSGIRQGCPLAPLLFLVVVEILAVAIQTSPNLQGLILPGVHTKTHIFSGFVDDSTLFLHKACQLRPALDIIMQFGRLSGLQVQPAKSQIIFLNTAIHQLTYQDIAVVTPSTTTRYLGYQVGTGKLRNINWVLRIKSAQRRLFTATQVATTLEHRVLILNAIVLPGILFTASFFEPPDWALKQLDHLYKQFLWKFFNRIEPGRHKVAPGLIYTPRNAGGIGLVSVPVAIKTQRVKHAILALTRPEDVYLPAWVSWHTHGAPHQTVSPHRSGVKRIVSSSSGQYSNLFYELGCTLQPDIAQKEAILARVREHLPTLRSSSTSWWEANDWVLHLSEPLPCRPLGVEFWPQEIEDFWQTFQWSRNPWILTPQASELSRSKYDRIADVSREQLHIQRTGPQ